MCTYIYVHACVFVYKICVKLNMSLYCCVLFGFEKLVCFVLLLCIQVNDWARLPLSKPG